MHRRRCTDRSSTSKRGPTNMRGCRNRRVTNLNLSRKMSVVLLFLVIVHLLIIIFGKWEQHARIFPFQVLEQKSKPPTQQVIQCNDTYSTKLMPAGTFPLVALASFPGSGNEWVRNMIERASGYATGSVYHIQSLEKGKNIRVYVQFLFLFF